MKVRTASVAPTLDGLQAEAARLATLTDYAILDTGPERSFDDLAQLAARVCQTPIALVSLIDARRQWFKARVGINVDHSPREHAFCTYAIRNPNAVFVVPDATQDPRFSSNPFVTGDPKVAFYAGAPLIGENGHALGTLCVIDRKPRTLSADQIDALQTLARQVVSQLELRRAASANARLYQAARRQARRRSREAQRDSLTGLYNRAAFARRVNQAIAASRQAGGEQSSAVLLLDLDHFKLVNDTAGHAAGDAVLRAVGRSILGSVRSSSKVGSPARPVDIVARLGGDEFTVLLNGLRSPADATLIAERILAGLDRPLRFEGESHRLGASVGIAAIGPRQQTVDDVLREADAAMYAAKSAGRGRAVAFDAKMHAASLRRIRLERDLRDVLDRIDFDGTPGGLHLKYQPLVDVSTGGTVGFEALVRWDHPSLGALSPADFVPIAEETGLIVRLGEWVIHEATRQLAEWTAADPATFGSLVMNVNVARRQLLEPNLLPRIDRALAQTGLSPGRLRLEITESSIMENADASEAALDRLRDRGLSLYMDDFGTGHSSLACLQRFPLDGLKIDRSFTSLLGNDPTAAPIVKVVLDLARCFNMLVTVEGVETAEQLEHLQRLGCDTAQGYFFAQPLSADAAAAFVRDASPSECADWAIAA